MNKRCSKAIAIVCDFDGTISVEDVNREVAKYFGGEEAEAINRKYRNSEIGLRENLQLQYEIMQVEEKVFDDYVIRNMKIDKTFFDLYDFAKRNKMEVVIVSGGFINYIKLLLKKYGMELDKLNMPVFSNKLVSENGVLKAEYGTVPNCHKHFGPCGICKYQHILNYKKNYKVIYVGDGFTDRCAAEAADVVFAKDNLATYCIDNNIDYFPFNSFKDVKDYIVNHTLI